MLKSLIKILLFTGLGATLYSCEEVIDIDLNSEDPKLVIEGSLKADEERFEVKISETTDFFDAETKRRIEGAAVVLYDDTGNEWMLSGEGDGLYATDIEPREKTSYRLSVTIDGTEYLAESYLPEAVAILGLETEYQTGGGPIEAGYQMFVRFQDDASVENYYRLKISVDGVFQNSGDDLRVTDDRLFNGGRARVPVFQAVFQEGETVEVELVHFDNASFEYFNSLMDIVANQEGPNGSTAAPGNPISNWSNGALGYFSASSSGRQTIVVQ
ncbi:MAG: DUF4249 domain-containing protein [Bacteroidia bacterium]